VSTGARVGATLAALGVLVVLDLGTKHWAASELRPRGTRTVARGQVILRYQENTGLVFGLLRDRAPRAALVAYSGLVALATAGVLGWLLLAPRPRGAAVLAGLAAMLAGSIGNLSDRVMRGYVVDFIDWSPAGRFSWPIFNAADVMIALGMVACAAGLPALHRAWPRTQEAQS